MLKPTWSRHAPPKTWLRLTTAFIVAGLLAAAAVAEFDNLGLKSGAAASQPSGGVQSWGFNGFGQLGTGDFSRQLVPVQSQAKSDFVQISSTTLADWTLALKTDGTVWGWGRNIEGQMADGTFTNRPSPVQVAPNSLTGVLSVAASAGAGSALKSDGTVWTWGDNSFGQGGNGTLGGHLPFASPILTDIKGNPFTGVKSLTGGGGHLLALKSDGTVWAWGFNQFGGVGNFGCPPLGVVGTCNHVPAPFQVVDALGVPLGGVVAIGAGGGHSLAVKADGTAWAWGYNGFGQIGDGTLPAAFGDIAADRHVPTQVLGITNAVAVSGGENWSMALLSDTTVDTWGFNDMGQLGNGTQAPRPVAAPLLSAGPTSAPVRNVKAIASATLHGLALLNNGSVLAWGQNDDGEGGNGSTTNPEAVPQPVSGLSNVLSIAASHNSSFALVPPVPPSADLAIAKSASPDSVSVTQNITYTLTVTNNGPDPATTVTLTDQLPTSVAFVFVGSTQGSCSGTSVATCNLGTLAKGASATVAIIAKAKTAGIATNTASVAAAEGDPNASNNKASVGTVILAANANCTTVRGHLQEAQVPGAAGLVTTGTAVSGEDGVRGRYDFTRTKYTSTGDPTIPSVLQFVGHSTFTTRAGVIRFTEAGALDQVNPGDLADVMTVTGGTGVWKDATGQLTRSGVYSLVTGKGQSEYQGQICTPRSRNNGDDGHNTNDG